MLSAFENAALEINDFSELFNILYLKIWPKFGLLLFLKIWPFWNSLCPNLDFLFIWTWHPWFHQHFLRENRMRSFCWLKAFDKMWINLAQMVKLSGYFLPNVVTRGLFAWQKKFGEINHRLATSEFFLLSRLVDNPVVAQPANLT